jgi:hypothetical protein
MSKADLNGWKAQQYEKLKARIVELEAENQNLLMANRDVLAWSESLRSDQQKALKALDDLARLGNGNTYGNSIGNCIAQSAIASMID